MSRTKRPEIVTTPPLMVARECAAAAPHCAWMM